MRIVVESKICDTPRVQQVRGMFDLVPEKISRVEWNVELPLHEKSWNIGLIVGPSGSGKTTCARNYFKEHWQEPADYSDKHKAVLDLFPGPLSIKEITELLCSVGFSSPPAWLRPYSVLSTGQKFRVALAKLLADAIAKRVPKAIVLCDEYSSVVDRTVAQIGSAAVARAVRAHSLKFVAVTCHEDVEAWLQPDWVYRPAENLFQWRLLQRRPQITLEVVRCQASAWTLFAPHHYLSHSLANSATCFLAYWQDRPVAFSSWLPFVGQGPPTRREHRTVTLPDYQGVGIGNVLSNTIAALWKALGYRAISTTSHPAMMRSRLKSGVWHMHRPPSIAQGREKKLVRLKHATTRLTAGFTFTGAPLPVALARLLLGK